MKMADKIFYLIWIMWLEKSISSSNGFLIKKLFFMVKIALIDEFIWAYEYYWPNIFEIPKDDNNLY